MAKGEIVAAVDVGTSKVCTVVAHVDPDNAVQVLGTGMCASKGMHKGLVANLDEASETLRDSIRKAEHTSGLKMKSAYFGVSGAHVNSWNKRTAVAVGKGVHPVSEWDVKRALATAQAPGMREERKVLHAIPQEYSLDGHNGVKDPIGMRGFRLDVDTHIITVDQSSLENLCECVRKAGMKSDGLVLNALGSAESALSSDEIEEGVVLVDIGAGTTDVAAFRNGTVIHTQVIAAGGNQISRDLAVGLGIPFDAAEQAKKEYGTLLRSAGKDGGETISLNGSGEVLRADVNEIIRARVEEILQLVYLQLPDAENYKARFPAGLVITGGTANLPGIDSVAIEMLGISARVGTPKALYGLSDELTGPAFTAAAGIVLWGAKEFLRQRREEAGISRKLVTNIKSLAPRWSKAG